VVKLNGYQLFFFDAPPNGNLLRMTCCQPCVDMRVMRHQEKETLT
jgi:hypothetical protein